MPEPDDQTDQLSRLDEWDAAVWKSIMEDSKGRYMVERLLDRLGSRQQRYQFDGDGLGAAWRDGRASAGELIEGELERFCPDLYLKMIRERRARIGRALKQQQQAEPQAQRPFRGPTDIERMADAQAAEDQAKQSTGSQSNGEHHQS